MSVYLLVRRKVQNIFLEADEADTVGEIKLMLEGILKKPPSGQKLYQLPNDDLISDEAMKLMQDDLRLNDYGINFNSSKAHCPARIGLVFGSASQGFEELEIEPYSNPPPLPDIMKPNAVGDDQMKH